MPIHKLCVLERSACIPYPVDVSGRESCPSPAPWQAPATLPAGIADPWPACAGRAALRLTLQPFGLPFGLSGVDFLRPCAGVESSSAGCLACHKLSLSVSVMQRLQASPPWPYLSSPVISRNKWNNFFPILGKAVSS